MTLVEFPVVEVVLVGRSDVATKLKGIHCLNAREFFVDDLRGVVPIASIDVAVPVGMASEMLFVVLFCRVVSVVEADKLDSALFQK